MLRKTDVFLSLSKYRVTQKLNNQLLRSELEAIEEVVNDSRVTRISEDDGDSLVRRRTTEKARRMIGVTRNRTVNSDKVRRFSDPVVSSSSPELSAEDSHYSNVFPINTQVPDRLAQFESLKGVPRYQDLTHAEARRVQELFERRKMLARRMQWLKNNQLVDPVAKVTKEMKLDQKRQHRKAAIYLPN